MSQFIYFLWNSQADDFYAMDTKFTENDHMWDEVSQTYLFSDRGAKICWLCDASDLSASSNAWNVQKRVIPQVNCAMVKVL